LLTDYPSFFRVAFNEEIDPYPYQIRLALNEWPDTLEIPTGLGKTAGIILAWLYKRQHKDLFTPRRLIYCLPLRSLVEQTSANALHWVENLIKAGFYSGHDEAPKIFTLMGGHIDRDWDWYPDRDAVIIGTQDQLLSRALNRGYTVSRFRWPIQFGLLNNDCLWVMDEIQLAGVGLTTATQLEAFRRMMGTSLPCRSLWMSATINREWFSSVDFRPYIDGVVHEGLSGEDRGQPSVVKKIKAEKRLQKVTCEPMNIPSVAQFTIDHHKPGSRTLVVVNTVRRAQEIYRKIEQLSRKAMVKPKLCLIHSRFRPGDRQHALDILMEPPMETGTICIATQVIEAGVDVSCRTLITDLAPWPSLIQRFGRANRAGEYSDAEIYWLDILGNGKGRSSPYKVADLADSQNKLQELQELSVCSDNLPIVSNTEEPLHVLRRKDIVDLFDTVQDLSGMDVDVSRFIRVDDGLDIPVFWRSFVGTYPLPDESTPNREELCNIPRDDLKGRKGWVWDPLAKRWVEAFTFSPGTVVMLRQADGGYSAAIGWTGEAADVPDVYDLRATKPEADQDDPWSELTWETIQEHTNKVVASLQKMLTQLELPAVIQRDLETAARWHDSGKAHEVAQQALVGMPPEADPSEIWAKTARRGIAYSRKGFRHELASGLALLENGHSDLAAYLAASHHGKVRLSIRSFPNESKPPENEVRFARGIWDGDILPEVALGNGETMPATRLDLSYSELGDGAKGPSWLSRMLALRDNTDIGIFRLAYLEALLRCSDWMASRAGDEND
jgi:CRISPR-associated endonuclease/helicase Cas3